MEDVFRNGFAEAESTPSPRVWENVNLELENHELHRYRRQVKWYRSMAAAFLFLLVSAGIILWRQDSALVGPPETGFATRQETTSRTAPGGLAAKEPAAASSVEKEPFKEKAPDPLAAVSRVFSENQPENRNQKITSSRARNQHLAQNEETPEARIAQQNPMAGASHTESTAALAKLEEKKVTGGEAVESQSVFPGNIEAKPFPGSLANSLAASQSLPSLLDSLPPAPKRSILVQKEAEPALAPAPPTEKGHESETAHGSKWSVTMAYSPQYAYAPVKIGNNAAMNERASLSQAPQAYRQYQEAVEEYNSSYAPAYSYSATVGASYKINDKWQLESGVMYTQNEATTTQSYLFYDGYMAGGAPVNFAYSKSTPLVANAFVAEAAGQAISVVRTNEYSTKYKYQKIGLPLRLAYRLDLRKVYALFSGGVNMNFLVQNAIVPETNQVQAVKFGLNDKDSPFRTLQWATTTSIGVGYHVTSKMSILVAPEFTYSLSPLLREEQHQENTYQLGVSIGGRWRLTK